MVLLVLINLITSQANAQCLKIIAITDGDTFKITIPHIPPVLGENLPVRLYGVDAPEMRADRLCERLNAIEARYFVKNLLDNSKCVTLYGMKRDKYFRIVGSVDADGVDLGAALIKKKLAVPYYGRKKPKWNCR